MTAPLATILVVDDESQNRRLLELLLQPEGYAVLTAHPSWVLGLVVTHYVFEHFPTLPEGQLSEVRASVVNSRRRASIRSGESSISSFSARREPGRSRSSTRRTRPEPPSPIVRRTAKRSNATSNGHEECAEYTAVRTLSERSPYQDETSGLG